MSKRILQVASASTSALAIAAAHWFPWPNLIGGRKLTRLEAYSVGTGIILVTSSTALFVADKSKIAMTPADCARLHIGTTIAAGIATVAAWTIDSAFNAPRTPITTRDL